MGCTGSKENAAKGGTASETGDGSMANALGGQTAQQAKAAETAAGGNGDASATASEAAATTATSGEPAKVVVNAINAEKMDLKDLVEKEPFHAVYTMGEVLGRGNYSTVRKGKRIGTDEVFAIKCIKESSLTPEDREALKIETAILKDMDSPHIIKLFGFYEEKKEKTYYIVTEFVGGGELFDRIIAKEYYSEEDAQKLVRTIASAIKYCHEQGVVHRDLKPENILLTSKDDDDSIKIADFGFAKQYDTSSDDALSTSCGTPGYVAPEILNGKKYGKEVDMWSFGVIIYILLCGYPPFHHENQKELFRQIRTANFQFDEEYWEHVSPAAKDLISKLLVVDGSKRLTIDQLLDHEWLKTKVTTNLTDIQPKLQNIINKRKLKAGINAVIAQNRIKKLLGSSQDGGDAAAAAAAAAPTAAEAAAAAAVAADAAPAVEAEAKPVAEAEAKPDAEAEAKPVAEGEAKAVADAEAEAAPAPAPDAPDANAVAEQ